MASDSSSGRSAAPAKAERRDLCDGDDASASPAPDQPPPRQNSAEQRAQTFGLWARTKRPKSSATQEAEQEGKSSATARRADENLDDEQARPARAHQIRTQSHKLSHSNHRPTRTTTSGWKSSTSALAAPDGPRLANAARLSGAVSLLQLNTQPAVRAQRTGANFHRKPPTCCLARAHQQQQQTKTTTTQQQFTQNHRQEALKQQQQQIANQRRASSLAAEVTFQVRRSLEGLAKQQLPRGPRGKANDSPATGRRNVTFGGPTLGVVASSSATCAPPRRVSLAARATSGAGVARAALKQAPSQPHASHNRQAPLAPPPPPPPPLASKSKNHQPTAPASVTNSRVRQGLLFARRQLHLTPIGADMKHREGQAVVVTTSSSRTSSKPTRTNPSQDRTVSSSCSSSVVAGARIAPTTSARRQLTRLTRAQPRPLATSCGQQVAATPPQDSVRERAFALFESASRRARGGSHAAKSKKLSLTSSSSSLSLDAPAASIKRPRAEPESQRIATRAGTTTADKRASLAPTPETTCRRRWSSLESSSNEASSTTVSSSSSTLSTSSSSSSFLASALVGGPSTTVGPYRTPPGRRAGRQRQRRASSPAVVAGERAGPADAAACGQSAAARAAAALSSTRRNNEPHAEEEQEKQKQISPTRTNRHSEIPETTICDEIVDRDERICDSGRSSGRDIQLIEQHHNIEQQADNLFKPREQLEQGRETIICPRQEQRKSESIHQTGGGELPSSTALFDNNQSVCAVGRQPAAEAIASDGKDAPCPSTTATSTRRAGDTLNRRQEHQIDLLPAPALPMTLNGNGNKGRTLTDDDDDDDDASKQMVSESQQGRGSFGLTSSTAPESMSCDQTQGQDENTNTMMISDPSGCPKPAESGQPEAVPLQPINVEHLQNQQEQHDEVIPKQSEPQTTTALIVAPVPVLPNTIKTAAKQAPAPARTDSKADIPIRQESILGLYDLETRPFARGKFAQVKRCVRRDTRECFAAKCIKKRRRLVDIKHEILLEIEALKLSYQTQYIVKLYEVYETPNEMVLILEMANGGELQRVLDDEEAIEEHLVRRMITQILEGLVHLHDNQIAHLDIKPQNLLLTEPFPNGDVKLCDFGISRRITNDCEIRDICGTPDYVAPEILRYDPISLATDMWSLGVLTYVLLSGYSPFGSENKQQTFCNITQANLDFPIEIFSKISEDAVDFIRKLIVREPSARLTSRQARNHHWISK